MGLFKRSGKGKQVPFETTIRISIPIDDDTDLENLNLSEILSGLDVDAPPGITIDSVQVSARIKNKK